MTSGPGLRTGSLWRGTRFLLVNLLAGLGLILAAELALRLAFPGTLRDMAEDLKRVEGLAYGYHPDYLVDLKPGMRKTFVHHEANGGRAIEWKTNADGFMGDALVPEPTFRVMVYGDSNIQARFSSTEQSFTGRLAHLLNAEARDVEVVNAGVIGFGPDQNLLKMRAGLDRYAPDLLILHVFADNDFGDLVRNLLFELDPEGELVATDVERTVDRSLRPVGSRLLTVRAASQLVRRVQRATRRAPRLPDHLPAALPAEVASAIARMQAASQREYAAYERGRRRQFSHFADHYDIDIALEPEGQAARSKVALMEAVLRETARVTAAHAVELVVLIQPSVRDVATNKQPHYEHFEAFPGYRRDRLTSTVDDICERNSIRRINLFPLFLENDPSSLYFPRDNDHWNERGQDLAARATAAMLLENFGGLLGAAAHPDAPEGGEAGTGPAGDA